MRPGVNLELATKLAHTAYSYHDWQADNIEGVLEYAHGCIYVGCRGTHKNEDGDGEWVDDSWSLIRDAISDIRFIPRKNKELGTYHPGGFLNAGEDVADQLWDFWCAHHKPLIISGHSLGGAAAAIAGEILLARQAVVLQVITFGAPRTGRLRRLNETKKIRQYKYGSDLVTGVPPFQRHAAPKLHKLKREGEGGPLKDHRMKNYEAAILRG